MSAPNVAGEVILRQPITRDHPEIPAIQMIEIEQDRVLASISRVTMHNPVE